jgi:hypothetical protein
MTILGGCPLYLVHLPLFRCLLRHLPFRYVAVCRLCECVSGVPVCGLNHTLFQKSMVSTGTVSQPQGLEISSWRY